ncbi:MAG: hypothetical protein JNM00_13095 [Flavobacteriales bacterium]|nr:hypothetical protein [Flavobacteriales bacterium]
MKKLLLLLCWTLIAFAPSIAQTLGSAFGIGGSDTDSGTSVDVDNAGRVLLVGATYAAIDVDPGPGVSNVPLTGSMDIYVALYAADGSVLVGFNIGSTGWDGYGEGQFTPDGNFVVAGTISGAADFDPGAGTTTLTPIGNKDIFIAKYALDGSLIWAKNIGGTGEDYPDALEVDFSSSVIIGGWFTGPADFDPGAGVANQVSTGATDNFIAKYDATGNYVWSLKYGSTGGETCYDLETDDAGDVYACGHFYNTVDFDPGAGTFSLSAGGFDAKAYAAKYSSSGNFMWAGMFGGTQSNNCNNLAIDNTGNVVLTGMFRGTGDFDPGAGTFNLTGESTLFYGDLFVLKLTPAGGFLWAKGIGPAGSLQSGYGIAAGVDDAVYVTGLVSTTTDFDPGPGVANQAAFPNGDCFLLKLNSDGSYNWASLIGSSWDSDYGNYVTYKNGGLYLCGSTGGTNIDLDMTAGTTLYSSVSFTRDTFLTHLVFDAVACPFTVEVTTTPYHCGIMMGTATAVVSGPGTFTYQWDDPLAQTTEMASGLVEGDYTVTVSDGTCDVVATGIVEPLDWCQGDFDLNTVVNVSDLLMFMAQYGANICPYDIDGNGIVNVNDLLGFMVTFGSSCE